MNPIRRRILQSISAAVVATVSGTLGVASASILDTIQANRVLRVAVPQDFPPFGSVGTDLQPRGYDIDMAQLIGERLGVQVQLIPVTSTNRIPYLTSGRADLIISSLGKNAEREAVIDFTDAYAPFFNGVFGPENESVHSAADLAGRSVGVTRGSVEDLELSAILPAGVTVRRFEDNNGTISAYLTGQVQFVATGNVIAAAINERSRGRRLGTKFLIRNSPCHIGVPKGEVAFIERLNAIIAAAKVDGTLNEISERWLNQPLPTDL
jgi:polar amino acid transport system substrate-binding protein